MEKKLAAVCSSHIVPESLGPHEDILVKLILSLIISKLTLKSCLHISQMWRKINLDQILIAMEKKKFFRAVR